MHNILIDTDAVCKVLKTNGKNIQIEAGKKLLIQGYDPIINNSVKIIDSSKLKLISSKAELEAGVYKYDFGSQVPDFKAGTILVSDIGEGYLRKVTSAVRSNNTMVVQTSQGTMEDLFTDAKFKINLDASELLEVNSNSQNQTVVPNSGGGEFTYNINPVTLLEAGTAYIKMEQCQFKLYPNMGFEYDFGLGGLNEFEMKLDKAILKGDLVFNMKLLAAIKEKTDTLKKFEKPFSFLVGQVPVKGTATLYIISKIEFSYKDDITFENNFNYQFDYTFNASTKFLKGTGWNNSFNAITFKDTLIRNDIETSPEMEIKVTVEPQLKIKFYGVVAPYLSFPSSLSLKGKYKRPESYWDLHLNTKSELEGGVDITILKYDIEKFGPKKFWTKDWYNYHTPFKIEKDTGDFQSSQDTVNFLPIPIRVKILDEEYLTQKGVKVEFKILSGTGSLSNSTVTTDANGMAEVNWRIGSQKEQVLEAKAFKGDGSPLIGSPLQFAASYGGKELKVVKVFNSTNTPVFTTNFFKQVGVGKGGHIYAGTINNGLYKCVDSTWTKLGLLTNNNINDIQTDQFGGVWIAQYGNTGAQATTGGINHFPDSSLNGFAYYGATLGAPTRNARGVFCDTTRTNGDGRPRLWTAHMAHITGGVSTTGAVGLGLNAANPFFNKITNGIDISLQNGSIPCIGGNSDEIWAYASVNFGKSQILRYSAVNGTLLGAYDYENTTVTGMTSNFIARAIHFDATGSRWIGLISGGLLVKENDNWININMPEILPAATAVSTNGISSGKFGKVFIATSQGLLIYNGGDKSIPASYTKVTTAEGLPSNNVLDAVERASDGLLIVTTDSGIAFITGH